MQLLIIRHAIAVQRRVHAMTAHDDTTRPLSCRGRARMQAVAHGLRHLVPQIDVLASSPLDRALQTAQIVASVYAADTPIKTPVLAPGGHPRAVHRWLGAQPTNATVAIVGHEPNLSELVNWMVMGVSGRSVRLRKGGACLLACHTPLDAGGCRLEWLLTPSHLRLLRP